ncbi:thioredoxin domain-containing protein 9 [Plasmopara halstedii]|uniref:Thioredoxin domain-containing protein 9 n=1 Tax=Plasmopara halstedii TaxID=4781 RepID=A0A0N7L3E7_PLAHL|nr:thioredoxin domain-containing protein 9 [Plasmopara halstedii]CEG35667.1 thioredoxin domain-containing protein 9 [Plasmopara halstedii]|eukprot:XP_024572036.1 thioredoxin domain-containing protein 9 [Plasmopara halstedii]
MASTSTSQAEMVASLIGEKVLETLDKKHQKLDETIKKLEKADDDELERLREKRLQAMQQKARKIQELRAHGHGEYSTICDTHDFFEVMKKSDKVVVHFFTPANAFCQLVDSHLTRLAPHHVETKFARINAEKAEYLVDKLGVYMIPCIALVHNQKVEKMVQGLDELGGTDKFSTAFLAYYLSLHKVLTYEGPEPENPLDDCGGAYASGKDPITAKQQLEERIHNIRQSIFYDSDMDEDD